MRRGTRSNPAPELPAATEPEPEAEPSPKRRAVPRSKKRAADEAQSKTPEDKKARKTTAATGMQALSDAVEAKEGSVKAKAKGGKKAAGKKETGKKEADNKEADKKKTVVKWVVQYPIWKRLPPGQVCLRT